MRDDVYSLVISHDRRTVVMVQALISDVACPRSIVVLFIDAMPENDITNLGHRRLRVMQTGICVRPAARLIGRVPFDH